ncbi:TetR/AcrR family transcriptional regulator [Uliginosibacterium paludis]|uniref:Helix-turn-helix domain-containing protein n=1 Tax=Uliginosibacterium paludis TaxID=1615952 RepID=A0ABV2CVY9_9RHOO
MTHLHSVPAFYKMSEHSLKTLPDMARPRSEDKQIALLDAATEVIALQGLGAPTALIAKRAGVAEGTLFRYFPNKDALLNAVYLHQCRNAAESTRCAWDVALPLEERMSAAWSDWIDWGVSHPAAFKAMAQLETSDKLSPEAREEGLKLCGDCQENFGELPFEGMSKAVAREFFNMISMAISQATIDFSLSHPDQTKAAKTVAFKLFCKGLMEP